MTVAALSARVIEVIADLGASAGSRYRYGSGCIVGGRTALTAAHVVEGAISAVVRDPDRQEFAATVNARFVGDADGPGPDLALLEITDPTFKGDLPFIALAAVDRTSAVGEPVEHCHAVGYPWFAETPSPTALRDTVDAIGVVPVLAKLKTGLLSVQVTAAPRELPPEQTALVDSEWAGMSGAPVFAAGCLLGVVTEHAPREGPSAIMAVPLTAIQVDPDHEQWGQGVADPAAWWSRLGVEGIGDLRRLPLLPPARQPPAYWSTLREFGRTLHQRMPQLIGRDRELRDIATFATGGEGYRKLEGGAFTGKTALLYEAVTVGLPDEVDVVSYFLSRRASDASSGRFLAAVIPQLAYLCDVDAPEVNVDQYHALWEQAAARAAESGRHLLLAVDGLDEDLRPPGSPSVASLLPAMSDAYMHVLVTSRLRPDLPDDVSDAHPLKQTAPVQLDPFKGAQKLADLAKLEIYDLTHGEDSDLAVDVLGVLTAAEGPLSLNDIVALQADGLGAPVAADTRRVRRVLEERAARSLERVGPAGMERYEFAHASLLEYAQTVPDLCDPEYRHRIHRWASQWQAAGWPIMYGGGKYTPRYLLDTYSATLAHDPQRLAQLVSDIGWIEAAVISAGVDRVLDDLRRAAAENLANTGVAAVLTAVTGQAHDLRPPQPVGQPGYTLRQLWMQAAELGEVDLADDIRSRLQSQPGPALFPWWTTRRSSRIWSSELGRHGGTVYTVAALADGRVVSGGNDKRVLIWDPAVPGTAPAELGRDNSWVTAVAVLADGRVVSGGNDGQVLIWDPAAPETLPAELGRHDRAVYVLAVLPNGRVVSGGNDGRVLVWDPAVPGTAVAELGRHDGWVTAVAVLADGQVVTAGSDRLVLIWDPAAPGTLPAELGRHDRGAYVLAVLADGRVVSGGNDGRVLVWDPAVPGTAVAELGRHDGWVHAVAVLADGRVVSGGKDGRVLVWDPAVPGTAVAELGRHDGLVTAVAVLADGRVVSAGSDRLVLIWDVDDSGNNSGVIPAHRDSRVSAVAVLADGRVVSGGNDGRVLVWDPAVPGTAVAELGRHDGRVNAVAVLADGQVVTAGSDRLVLIWDPAAPGTLPTELGRHDGRVNAVAVLADGRVVSGGSDRLVLIWDPAVPGTAVAQLGRHDGRVNAVAVLADGRVVSGGNDGRNDGRVLIWDPAVPGTALAELGRHYGRVNAVAVLADGRVVSGGSEELVLVWDPAAPEILPTELGRHDGRVNAVAVLADGRVVTGGSDQLVLIWDPARPNTRVIQLNCSLTTLATAPSGATSTLAIAHRGGGFSLWSVRG